MHYPNLTNQNLATARKLLTTVTRLLDSRGIRYHLEGGTLLGIVRDRDLLHWDHDVDISIPAEFAPDIPKLKFALLKCGYKISIRKSKVTKGPIQSGQYSLFKIKPLFGYFMRALYPKYELIVLDIFVKTEDNHHTYWQAADKVMRVDNKYYVSFETVEYQGQQLKVPNYYRDYLTQKYGDWSVPVKEWDCSKQELTIFNPAS